MPMKWYGGLVNAQFKQAIRERLEIAGQIVEAEAKGIMKLGGRSSTGTNIDEAGNTISESNMAKVGTYRSKPGEPPRVQTGTLRRSITHEMDPTLPIVRIGSGVKYGLYLEMGTDKMAPRPFLRPALVKSKKKIIALFRKPINIK